MPSSSASSSQSSSQSSMSSVLSAGRLSGQYLGHSLGRKFSESSWHRIGPPIRNVVHRYIKSSLGGVIGNYVGPVMGALFAGLVGESLQFGGAKLGERFSATGAEQASHVLGESLRHKFGAQGSNKGQASEAVEKCLFSRLGIFLGGSLGSASGAGIAGVFSSHLYSTLSVGSVGGSWGSCNGAVVGVLLARWVQEHSRSQCQPPVEIPVRIIQIGTFVEGSGGHHRYSVLKLDDGRWATLEMTTQSVFFREHASLDDAHRTHGDGRRRPRGSPSKQSKGWQQGQLTWRGCLEAINSMEHNWTPFYNCGNFANVVLERC